MRADDCGDVREGGDDRNAARGRWVAGRKNDTHLPEGKCAEFWVTRGTRMGVPLI